MWIFINFLVFTDEFDDSHPSIAPATTRIIVISFMDNGRFVASTVLGIDHSIIDPVVIDINAIMIIGLITLVSSLEDACGLWSRGLHTVAIENRIE